MAEKRLQQRSRCQENVHGKDANGRGLRVAEVLTEVVVEATVTAGAEAGLVDEDGNLENDPDHGVIDPAGGRVEVVTDEDLGVEVLEVAVEADAPDVRGRAQGVAIEGVEIGQEIAQKDAPENVGDLGLDREIGVVEEEVVITGKVGAYLTSRTTP